MLLTIEEHNKRIEELKQEIRNIKEEIERAKTEEKKDYLKVILKEKQEEEEELYFTPTKEDIEEMKYWI